MTVVLLAKKLRSLYPVDEGGEDWLQHLAQGEIVEVAVRRPRNVRFHRLFWGLASLCWQQMDDRARYPTVEALVTQLKLETGHYDRRDMVLDGVHYPVLTPRSISFAAMDEDAFKLFFDRCADWLTENVLPGVTRQELRDELEHMLGAKVEG